MKVKSKYKSSKVSFFEKLLTGLSKERGISGRATLLSTAKIPRDSAAVGKLRRWCNCHVKIKSCRIVQFSAMLNVSSVEHLQSRTKKLFVRNLKN